MIIFESGNVFLPCYSILLELLLVFISFVVVVVVVVVVVYLKQTFFLYGVISRYDLQRKG